jgi:hypothetical protein
MKNKSFFVFLLFMVIGNFLNLYCEDVLEIEIKKSVNQHNLRRFDITGSKNFVLTVALKKKESSEIFHLANLSFSAITPKSVVAYSLNHFDDAKGVIHVYVEDRVYTILINYADGDVVMKNDE